MRQILNYFNVELSNLARDPKTMNENLPWFCKTIFFLCLGPKSSPKCKCWVHCINSKLAHVPVLELQKKNASSACETKSPGEAH